MQLAAKQVAYYIAKGGICFAKKDQLMIDTKIIQQDPSTFDHQSCSTNSSQKHAVNGQKKFLF